MRPGGAGCRPEAGEAAVQSHAGAAVMTQVQHAEFQLQEARQRLAALKDMYDRELGGRQQVAAAAVAAAAAEGPAPDAAAAAAPPPPAPTPAAAAAEPPAAGREA